MKINEIFKSIQGEGILSGLPTIFIRASGCNLRCSWCDTKYAYHNGKELGLNDIFLILKKLGCKRVCITGGEPLLQKGSIGLINLLLKNKYLVSIETNGSKDISRIPSKVLISLDIKCPSSKQKSSMLFSNLRLLKQKDQCKFIIKGKKDYEYAPMLCLLYSKR